MFAGFLPLLFNPQAWIVVGLTALLSFSGGIVKGWNASSADQWRKVAIAAQQAAKDKERLSDQDRRRAEAAEADSARLDVTLREIIHNENIKASACRFSAADLDRLRSLSGTNARRR